MAALPQINSCTPQRLLGPSGPRAHAGAGPTPRPSHSAVQRANRGAGAGPKSARLRVTLSTQFFYGAVPKGYRTGPIRALTVEARV